MKLIFILVVLLNFNYCKSMIKDSVLYENKKLKYAIHNCSEPEFLDFFSGNLGKCYLKTYTYINTEEIVIKPVDCLGIINDSIVLKISEIDKVYRWASFFFLNHSGLYIKMKDGKKHILSTWNRRSIIRAIKRAQKIHDERLR